MKMMKAKATHEVALHGIGHNCIDSPTHCFRGNLRRAIIASYDQKSSFCSLIMTPSVI